MSTTDPSRTGRTGDRPGGGMPRPATPVVAVIIAAVAGLLGLLILRDVTNDSSRKCVASRRRNSVQIVLRRVGRTRWCSCLLYTSPSPRD